MTDNQWISFSVEGEVYAHAIKAIKEIIPYSDPAPVPGAAEHIEGILNVRGTIVSILSARMLFNLNPQTDRINAKIIILEKDNAVVGISVDSVGEIINFAPNEAEWTNTTGEESLIKGTLQQEGQLYILANFMDLKSDEEKYA